MNLNDKISIVTGAASGIGLAIAKRYAAAGSKVAIADLKGDGSWAVSAEVEGAEGLATLGTGIDPPRPDTNTTRRCRIWSCSTSLCRR